MPPPNVTGSLHMGHALNNTLQDILVRFERMRGKNVLWQPGMDHAGIATQMVVERQLMEKQIHRPDLTRDELIETGGAILNQLKRLGASADWSRERFTMDEGLSKAVLEVFVTLYKEGLIYKDKRLVNWDPKLLTAISDLEVEQQEVNGNLWHFRYPVEGEVLDPENPKTFITVATTRPETMLGDMAVGGASRRRAFPASCRQEPHPLPIVGRRIPVVADEYSDPEKGSGAVKITPAHDFNEFEVGRRHILTVEAAVTLTDNDDFLAGLEVTPERQAVWDELDGLDRLVAHKKIAELIPAVSSKRSSRIARPEAAVAAILNKVRSLRANVSDTEIFDRNLSIVEDALPDLGAQP
ncbi:class I tRNA ligase family protein [Mesorhizobium sp. M0092]